MNKDLFEVIKQRIAVGYRGATPAVADVAAADARALIEEIKILEDQLVLAHQKLGLPPPIRKTS